MLNTVLLESAGRVIASKAPTNCTLVAHFISAAEGSKFSFYPIFIDSVSFLYDYAGGYGDEIDLEMTIAPSDYARMQDQGQDLLCVVTITYVDRYGKQVLSPAPRCKQYRAIINNPEDVRKSVPDIQVYTEPSKQISVRLMEETVYNLRTTKINTIYQTVTVEQAIYAIAQDLGIGKVHLVPPDNVHVYDHITIGSYQGIASIFGYLQSTVGIYQKGVNSYVTGGVLYVYPPYETNPVYDKTAIFYQVDTGRYAGSNVFHKTEQDSISIVINSQPNSEDLSITGAENIGTGVIFNRASRMGDGYTTIDSNQGPQFTQDSAMTISLANPRTAVGQRNNLKYIHGTDNPFPAMSELIFTQASLMTVDWPFADPFQMDPCQKLIYYYDRNEVMVKKTGIQEKALYVFTRQQKLDTKYMFSCNAQLILRLSPNETKVL